MNYALFFKGRCIITGDLIFCQDLRDRLIAEGRDSKHFQLTLAGPTDVASIPDELKQPRVDA